MKDLFENQNFLKVANLGTCQFSKYQSFGVVNQEETRLQMFTDAIRDKKVTRFIKDWALKNKDVIDLGIKKGKITKQQAIEDLGMVNEYR